MINFYFDTPTWVKFDENVNTRDIECRHFLTLLNGEIEALYCVSRERWVVSKGGRSGVPDFILFVPEDCWNDGLDTYGAEGKELLCRLPFTIPPLVAKIDEAGCWRKDGEAMPRSPIAWVEIPPPPENYKEEVADAEWVSGSVNPDPLTRTAIGYNDVMEMEVAEFNGINWVSQDGIIIDKPDLWLKVNRFRSEEIPKKKESGFRAYLCITNKCKAKLRWFSHAEKPTWSDYHSSKEKKSPVGWVRVPDLPS